jgi:membrane associated rhomboid family serine protease
LNWKNTKTGLKDNLKISFYLIIFLWILHLLDFIVPIVDLNSYGIHPRKPDGIIGIFLAPFLHANIMHLLGNSLALFVLLFFSLQYSRILLAFAVLIIIIFGGFGTWLLGGENTNHIGASGIVYGLIAYLLFNGFFRKEWKAILISLIIALLYSGQLIGLLSFREGISWESHIFGFIGGIVAAYLVRGRKYK